MSKEDQKKSSEKEVSAESKKVTSNKDILKDEVSKKNMISKKPKKVGVVNKESKVAAPIKRGVRKVLGDPQEQMLKRMRKVVSKINKLEKNYTDLTEKALKEESLKLKERAKTEDLDSLLPEAFAVVREAAKRALGQRHYDVQLIGGMVLHEGNVAELKTGEGKTLMATLAMYLNALSGKGSHLVTVNDYLVQRDAGWMAKVYDMLGMSIGVIIPDHSFLYDAEYVNKDHKDERFWHLKPVSRKEAYGADITYGTNNEYGFDYLRDNMVEDVQNLVQRGRNFAVVDEVDSILIDEARTPLIISAAAAESSAGYKMFAEIATHFELEDYLLEEKRHAVNLTDAGIAKVEGLLGIETLYDPKNIHHIYHLEQALTAQTLYKKDKDYVATKDGEIVIVDSFTGRLLPGRRYSEGLHQAIEAKESVRVQEESVTLATTSFQNYFRLYDKLSGMTGTAKTEAEEFNQVYDMEVVEVPTNRALIRKDLNDRIYATERVKFKAIAAKVKELNEAGQPVLIGSVSIEKNEILSKALSSEGIKHSVLNAKNNEGEAEVIERAGEKGAVTLATNIAGRGTDIVLSEDVKKLGGLFVLGSERHESRRIDNQLRGRAGRQGDPGRTQFYISAEDELMRVFGGDTLSSLMTRFSSETEEPIEKRSISKAIERSQKLVEGMGYDSRKQVVQYDDVMNRHRRAVYSNRRAMLEAKDRIRIDKLIKESVDGAVQDGASKLVDLAIAKDFSAANEFIDFLDQQFKFRDREEREIRKILGLEESSATFDKKSDRNRAKAEKEKQGLSLKRGASSVKNGIKFGAKSINPLSIPSKAKVRLKARKENSELAKKRKLVIKKVAKVLEGSFEDSAESLARGLDEETVFIYKRFVYLKTLDELWMQHLENMQHLRDGIGWRSVGQKDPLVEYRFEGQKIFEELLKNLRVEVVHQITSVSPKAVANSRLETELTKAAGRAIDNADEIVSGQKEFSAEDFNGSVRVIEDVEIETEGGITKTVDNSKSSISNKPSSNKKNQQKSKKKQRQNKKKGRH